MCRKNTGWREDIGPNIVWGKLNRKVTFSVNNTPLKNPNTYERGMHLCDSADAVVTGLILTSYPRCSICFQY